MGGKCFRPKNDPEIALSEEGDNADLMWKIPEKTFETEYFEEKLEQITVQPQQNSIMTQYEKQIEQEPQLSEKQKPNKKKNTSSNFENIIASKPAKKLIEKNVSVKIKETVKEYKQLQEKAMKMFIKSTGNPRLAKAYSRKKKNKNKGKKASIKLQPDSQIHRFLSNEETSHSASPSANLSDEEVIKAIETQPNEIQINANEPKLDKHQVNQKRTNGKVRKIRKGWGLNHKNTTKYIKKSCTTAFFEKLNEEIQEELKQNSEFMSEVKPLGEIIRKQIETLAIKKFEDKNISAVMYGSMATELAYEQSDFDVVICGLNINSQERLGYIISSFSSEVVKLPFVKNCNPITTARIPVIKLDLDLTSMNNRGRYKEFKMDITFDHSIETYGYSTFSGIQCIELVAENIRAIPELKPVTILLKKLLYLHDLNKPYFGGMSSYILFLMLSAILRASVPYKSVGHCFLGMLHYYGIDFNCNCTIITPDCIVIAPIPEIIESNADETCSTLFVADPFHPELNAAAKVTRFTEIKKCFTRTYECLLDISENFQNGENIRILETAYKAAYVQLSITIT